MATGTFLDSNDIKSLTNKLQAPTSQPDAHLSQSHIFKNSEFSDELSNYVLAKIEKSGGWLKAHPILLGSWGRGELCPGSDLDVLFVGAESDVANCLSRLAEQGIKLRQRMPEDSEDWTKGIEALEINTLFWAKPLTDDAAILLKKQVRKLKQNKNYREGFVQAVDVERKTRHKRFDSIANFLEPNIKFGPGGMRDLQQSLFLLKLFAEDLGERTRAHEIFSYYKNFYLSLRQFLHLNSYKDHLVATAQTDLVTRWGFVNIQDFMIQVQRGLSRVSFYSDWLLKQSLAIASGEKQQTNDEIESSNMFSVLATKPDINNQHRVRHFLKSKAVNTSEFYSNFVKYFSVSSSEELLVALFESGLVAKAVEAFDRCRGWVQHDQYHRYTLDAHLLQACRYTHRFFSDQNNLGKLQEFSKEFTENDWQSLLWAALYHDLGKGLDGHHSIEGARLVDEDFPNYSLSRELQEDVKWLVSCHLLLSDAAFRKNHRSAETKKLLYSKGVTGRRLKLLAIFTAIDIVATNPEAWTPWKEGLIYQLVCELEEKQSLSFYEFQKKVAGTSKSIEDFCANFLDPAITENLNHDILIEDLKAVDLAGSDLPILVRKGDKEGAWVRFHRKADDSGLFGSFVESLWQAGCSVRHAFVTTHDHFGVYDWFHVRAPKGAKVLKNRLQSQKMENESLKVSDLGFSDVILVSESNSEWVYSFRGKDSRGMLTLAAQTLATMKLSIRWAKVHTWGRQIDDIFGINPSKKFTSVEILESLREKLVKN